MNYKEKLKQLMEVIDPWHEGYEVPYDLRNKSENPDAKKIYLIRYEEEEGDLCFYTFRYHGTDYFEPADDFQEEVWKEVYGMIYGYEEDIAKSKIERLTNTLNEMQKINNAQ